MCFCVFCYRSYIPGDKINDGIVKRFRNLLGRFIGKKLKDNWGKSKGNGEFGCCEDCEAILKSFCELYHQLECLKVKLEWTLGRLVEVMKLGSRVPSRVEQLNRVLLGERGTGGCRQKSFKSSRRDLIRTCNLRISKSQPRVFLERVSSGEDGDIGTIGAVHRVTRGPENKPRFLERILGWLLSFSAVSMLVALTESNVSLSQETFIPDEISTEEDKNIHHDNLMELDVPEEDEDKNTMQLQQTRKSYAKDFQEGLTPDPVFAGASSVKKEELLETNDDNCSITSSASSMETGGIEDEINACDVLSSGEAKIQHSPETCWKSSNNPVTPDVEKIKIHCFLSGSKSTRESDSSTNILFSLPGIEMEPSQNQAAGPREMESAPSSTAQGYNLREKRKRSYHEDPSDQDSEDDCYSPRSDDQDSSSSCDSEAEGKLDKKTSVSSSKMEQDILPSGSSDTTTKLDNCTDTANKMELGTLVIISESLAQFYPKPTLLNNIPPSNGDRLQTETNRESNQSVVSNNMEPRTLPNITDTLAKFSSQIAATMKIVKSSEKPSNPNGNLNSSTPNDILNSSKPDDNFKCKFCDVSKLSARDLALHEAIHAFRPDNPQESKNSTIKFSCPRCPSDFIGKGYYIRHHLEKHLQISHHSEETCVCSICKAVVITKHSQKHFLTFHKTDGLDPAKIQRCDKCSAYFLTSRQLTLHKYILHYQRKCPVCQKSFAGDDHNLGVSLIMRHLTRNHVDFNPFPHLSLSCDLKGCFKRFGTQGELDHHKKNVRHHEDEMMQCSKCGKKYQGQHRLKAHMTVVHGQHAHICPECGKTFRSKGLLKTHLRYHEKPEEWKSECGICGKKCVDKYKLAEHSRTHSKEKPFVCQFCGEKYAHRHNWIGHMKTKHREERSEETSTNSGNFLSRKGTKKGECILAGVQQP